MQDITFATGGIGHNRPPVEAPETLTSCCPRYPVAKLLDILPEKYLSQVRDRAPNACCREVESHDIEAFKSNPARTQEPDVYILYCGCGRKHRRLCGGGGDERPFWEVR